MRSERGRAVGFALLLACTPAPAADDEAGVTTSPSTGAELDEGESSTSTTDTTSTTSTTDTTSDEGSGNFVPQGDWGGESCMCDPFAQDCPQGEKCVPFALEGDDWDCTKCVPVLGDQAAGEACKYDGVVVGTDDCDASSWCFTGEGEGTCHGFCTGTGDNPMCPADLQCWVSNHMNITVCVPGCDPVLQDCEQGTACYWSGSLFGCVFTGSANLSAGEPCDTISGCAPGLHCTDAETLPSCGDWTCCSPICEVGLGDVACDALPGTTCLPFFAEGEAPQGYEHVGLCISP